MANSQSKNSTIKPYSYHTFIYPFYIDGKNIEKISKYLNDNCKEIIVNKADSNNPEDIVRQNSYQYFFPQIQSLLFSNDYLKHYRVKNINGCKYQIEKGSIKYLLPINDIKVTISEHLKIGLVRFEMAYYGNKIVDEKEKTERNKNNLFNDVLVINDIGRRLYTASRSKEDPKNTKVMTADKINIIGRKGFDISFPTKMYSSRIDVLEKLIFNDTKDIDIVSILDDRMFVMSAVIDPRKMQEVKTGKLSKNTLYEFYFIDSPGNCSCQDARLLDRILEEHAYNRWLDAGTTYGLSEYSFVMLTNGRAEHIVDAFLSTYVRMAELVLLQRAALVRLDIEASYALPDNDFKIENIKELHKNKMYFSNSLYAEEVTFQQQGIEIYDMLKKFLRIKILNGIVERKVDSLNAYLNSQNERHNRDISDAISIFSILTLLTGAYNMITKHDKWIVLAIGLVILSGIAYIGFNIFKQVKNRKEIEDKNIVFKSYVYLGIIVLNAFYICLDLYNKFFNQLP